MGISLLVMIGFFILELGKTFDKAIVAASEEAIRTGRTEGINTYEDFGEASLGETGIYMVRTTCNVMNFGILTGWIILIGTNLFALMPGLGLGVKGFIIASSPIIVGLGQCTNMQLISRMGVLGAVSAIGSFSLIVIKSLLDSRRWMDWGAEDRARLHQPWPDSVGAVGFALAIFINSYSTINMFPSLRSQMRAPSEFYLAFRNAMFIVTSVYVTTALVGHFGYGAMLQKTIVLSMKFSPANATEAFNKSYLEWTGPQSPVMGNTMALLVTVNLMTSFPILFTVLMGGAERAFGEAVGERGDTKNRLWRLGLSCFLLLVAILCPYFMEVLGCFSSICASLNNVLWIILFSFRLERSMFATQTTKQRAVDLLMISTALYAMVFGFSTSLSVLLAEEESHSETV